MLVHIVWGTQHRAPLLQKQQRDLVFAHIKENARAKQIFVLAIGGYVDHVHCLVSLAADQSIAKVVQLIKGESSHWANENQIIRPKLAWAGDYFAASVSKSMFDTARAYIENQETHHQTKTFAEEYTALLKSQGMG